MPNRTKSESEEKLGKYAELLGKRGGRGHSNLAPPDNKVIEAARALGKKGGVLGGINRANNLSPQRRKDIATWASLVAKMNRNPASMTTEDLAIYENFKKLGYKTREEY